MTTAHRKTPGKAVSNKVPFYRDDDQDGFGRAPVDPDAGIGDDLSYACPGALLAGWSELDGDCNDNDDAIHPDAPENWYDDVDENCDGNLDDQDDDGLPGGENGSDCDDLDETIDNNSCHLQEMNMSAEVACGFWGTEELVCWGNKNDDAYPKTESTNPGDFTSIDVGTDTACVVNTMGVVECLNENSALSVNAPTQSPDDSTFVSISVHGESACALTKNGSLYCWSDSGEDTRYPKTKDFQEIDQGEDCACALTQQGSATCWSSASSDCAEGPDDNQKFVSLSVGKKSACALNEIGKVECWGEATFLDTLAPKNPVFQAISVDGESACALNAEGQATCWGNMDQSETLGGALDWIKVENDCACGRKSDDQEVECWGSCSEKITEIPTWSN